MYRQGDVFIIPVKDDSAEGLEKVKRDRGRIVLAYGEVTGHAHAIAAPQADLFTLVKEDNAALGNDNDRLLVCLETVDLGHEEHDTIKLPAGHYIVRRQREYSPEAIRTVAD